MDRNANINSHLGLIMAKTLKIVGNLQAFFVRHYAYLLRCFICLPVEDYVLVNIKISSVRKFQSEVKIILQFYREAIIFINANECYID